MKLWKPIYIKRSRKGRLLFIRIGRLRMFIEVILKKSERAKRKAVQESFAKLTDKQKKEILETIKSRGII